MLIRENQPLGRLNTFGIDANARLYVEIDSDEALHKLVANKEIFSSRHMILGEGSNILFTRDYPGTIIRLTTKGKEVVERKEGHIFLRVKAGEVWDELVAYCVEKGWGGIENLSLIPGQVGSSPIQNIGAYGAELEEHFDSLEAYDKQKGEMVHFAHKNCHFGYRNSLFKGIGKDRYMITTVTLRLDEKPRIKTNYGSIKQELTRMGVVSPGIAQVREAVCRIRREKLPDPDQLGNAGSFFKNPVVSMQEYDRIKEKHPGVIAYPVGNQMKLAAGWLIDEAGWKGFRKGDAGVHDKQALVLVNHGSASGNDIMALAKQIMKSVKEMAGVTLEPEVNIM